MLFPCIIAALAATTQEQGSCDAPPPDATYAADPPCFFPTEFLAVPVLSVRQETHNSKVLRFGLPEGVSLSLPVSSAIVLNAPMADGKSIARPYNPISSNDQLGSFDLLVKVYPEGKVSQYVNSLKPGDRVSFKQVKPNLKPFRYPFGKASITMVAGGTGVAPMIQALHPLLSTPGDSTRVRLLFGNLSPADIMLQVHYVVGRSADEAAVPGWEGEAGWIDEDKLKRLAFPPAADTAVWLCGLDEMYKSLAGSRLKALAPGSVLARLGYSEDMVWRS
jgi:cytochrome-b5 reductase